MSNNKPLETENQPLNGQNENELQELRPSNQHQDLQDDDKTPRKDNDDLDIGEMHDDLYSDFDDIEIDIQDYNFEESEENQGPNSVSVAQLKAEKEKKQKEMIQKFKNISKEPLNSWPDFLQQVIINKTQEEYETIMQIKNSENPNFFKKTFNKMKSGLKLKKIKEQALKLKNAVDEGEDVQELAEELMQAQKIDQGLIQQRVIKELKFLLAKISKKDEVLQVPEFGEAKIVRKRRSAYFTPNGQYFVLLIDLVTQKEDYEDEVQCLLVFKRQPKGIKFINSYTHADTGIYEKINQVTNCHITLVDVANDEVHIFKIADFQQNIKYSALKIDKIPFSFTYQLENDEEEDAYFKAFKISKDHKQAILILNIGCYSSKGITIKEFHRNNQHQKFKETFSLDLKGLNFSVVEISCSMNWVYAVREEDQKLFVIQRQIEPLKPNSADLGEENAIKEQISQENSQGQGLDQVSEMNSDLGLDENDPLKQQNGGRQRKIVYYELSQDSLRFDIGSVFNKIVRIREIDHFRESRKIFVTLDQGEVYSVLVGVPKSSEKYLDSYVKMQEQEQEELEELIENMKIEQMRKRRDILNSSILSKRSNISSVSSHGGRSAMKLKMFGFGQKDANTQVLQHDDEIRMISYILIYKSQHIEPDINFFPTYASNVIILRDVDKLFSIRLSVQQTENNDAILTLVDDCNGKQVNSVYLTAEDQLTYITNTIFRSDFMYVSMDLDKEQHMHNKKLSSDRLTTQHNLFVDDDSINTNYQMVTIVQNGETYLFCSNGHVIKILRVQNFEKSYRTENIGEIKLNSTQMFVTKDQNMLMTTMEYQNPKGSLVSTRYWEIGKLGKDVKEAPLIPLRYFNNTRRDDNDDQEQICFSNDFDLVMKKGEKHGLQSVINIYHFHDLDTFEYNFNDPQMEKIYFQTKVKPNRRTIPMLVMDAHYEEGAQNFSNIYYDEHTQQVASLDDKQNLMIWKIVIASHKKEELAKSNNQSQTMNQSQADEQIGDHFVLIDLRKNVQNLGYVGDAPILYSSYKTQPEDNEEEEEFKEKYIMNVWKILKDEVLSRISQEEIEVMLNIDSYTKTYGKMIIGTEMDIYETKNNSNGLIYTKNLIGVAGDNEYVDAVILIENKPKHLKSKTFLESQPENNDQSQEDLASNSILYDKEKERRELMAHPFLTGKITKPKTYRAFYLKERYTEEANIKIEEILVADSYYAEDELDIMNKSKLEESEKYNTNYVDLKVSEINENRTILDESPVILSYFSKLISHNESKLCDDKMLFSFIDEFHYQLQNRQDSKGHVAQSYFMSKMHSNYQIQKVYNPWNVCMVLNSVQGLDYCLEKLGYPEFSDLDHEVNDPMIFSLGKESGVFTEAIAVYMITNEAQRKYLRMDQSTLNELISRDTSIITNFLQEMCYKTQFLNSEIFQKPDTIKTEQSYVYASQKDEALTQDLFRKANNGKKSKDYELYLLTAPCDLKRGSPECIKTILALSKCNSEILLANKPLIMAKYTEHKRLSIFQWILFFIMTVSFYISVILYTTAVAPLVIAIISCCILIIIDFFQLIGSIRMRYFKKYIWNFYRVMTIVSYVAIFLCNGIRNLEERWVYILITIAIIFMGIRFISLFKIFDSYRALISMVFECAYGTIPFMSLMALFIGIFAFAMMEARELSTSKFPVQISYMYTLAYGAWEFDDNENNDTLNNFQWVIFFLASLTMTLIMLNLLISIISDIYARVTQNSEVQDLKERVGTILEWELFWNSRRKQTEELYKKNLKYHFFFVVQKQTFNRALTLEDLRKEVVNNDSKFTSTLESDKQSYELEIGELQDDFSKNSKLLLKEIDITKESLEMFGDTILRTMDEQNKGFF